VGSEILKSPNPSVPSFLNPLIPQFVLIPQYRTTRCFGPAKRQPEVAIEVAIEAAIEAAKKRSSPQGRVTPLRFSGHQESTAQPWAATERVSAIHSIWLVIDRSWRDR